MHFKGQVLKWVYEIVIWRFLVWNRVRIWRTGWHTPSKNSQEYPHSLSMRLALDVRLLITKGYWCSTFLLHSLQFLKLNYPGKKEIIITFNCKIYGTSNIKWLHNWVRHFSVDLIWYLIITQYAFSLQSSYHLSAFSNIRDLIIQWHD